MNPANSLNHSDSEWRKRAPTFCCPEHKSVTQVHCLQMKILLTLITVNNEEEKQMDIDTDLAEMSSKVSDPPPPPVHRRSPRPRELPEDNEDVVSETSDCSMVIRMAPHSQGEAVLSVERQLISSLSLITTGWSRCHC
ncbi:hypothetical protein GJAV_G00228920 [Gymnothorax javanicus]|nr:hypothetical protein GJAV_G00228920 [Gymnothorax javanicus]